METTTPGIELIKQSEGFRSEPYKDVGGIWTVGYGHTQKAMNPISHEEAELLLKKDLKNAEKVIETHVKVPLTQNQFNALVSFIFNVGEGKFRGSTLLKLLNQGMYEEAAGQFTRWVYAGGAIQKGLIKRREAEKDLFLA